MGDLIKKSDILAIKSEEELFSMYLGIIPRANKLFKSPLRKDRRPTCSFHRNKSGLVFKDFGINKSYSFVDIVMEKYGLSYPKALTYIAKDIGLIKDILHIPKKQITKFDYIKIEESDPCNIGVTVKDFSEEELSWWAKYNISKELLVYFNVFSLKAVFLNNTLNALSTNRSPIFGYFFGYKKSLEMWKIYFPLRKKYRFLLNNSCIQGLEQIKGIDGKFVVITKSYKDVICMRSFGIYAVAPQSECVVVDERLISYLKKHFKYIIFNGDWDNTGKLFMINNRRKYGGICLTFKNRSFWEKDFSDNVAKFGPEKIKLLINFLKNKYLR